MATWNREKNSPQKRKNYPALRWFITCHHSDVHIHKLGECFSTKAKYPNNYQEIYICCPQSGIHNWRPLATSIFSVGKHLPSLRTAYSHMIMSPILSNFLPWYEQKKYWNYPQNSRQSGCFNLHDLWVAFLWMTLKKKTFIFQKLSLVYSYL